MADSPGIVEWAQPQSQPVRRPVPVSPPAFFWNPTENGVLPDELWYQPQSQPIPNNFVAKKNAYMSSLVATGSMPWPSFFGPEAVTEDRWHFQLPQPYPLKRYLGTALQMAESHPLFTGPGAVTVQKAPVQVLGLVIGWKTDIVRN